MFIPRPFQKIQSGSPKYLEKESGAKITAQRIWAICCANCLLFFLPLLCAVLFAAIWLREGRMRKTSGEDGTLATSTGLYRSQMLVPLQLRNQRNSSQLFGTGYSRFWGGWRAILVAILKSKERITYMSILLLWLGNQQLLRRLSTIHILAMNFLFDTTITISSVWFRDERRTISSSPAVNLHPLYHFSIFGMDATSFHDILKAL